jgi:glucose 1-dehydrogenase
MRFTGKVAIVTGAGSGIGQAIAFAFAQEGASVVVDYVGDPAAAAETLGKIAQLPNAGTAVAIAADVSQPDQVAGLFAQTIAKFGRLDILVNNAGIEKKFPITEFPYDAWQKILAVNLTGPFLCAQAAARQFLAQNAGLPPGAPPDQNLLPGGRIINISSIHEDLPMPTNAPYCATKGGLRMLMRTMAVELAPHQITVNNIGPGAIYTPIDKDVQADPKLEAALMAEIPMGRWGKPEEVAALALFLASDDAAYITGSTHFIDGAMLRQAGSL